MTAQIRKNINYIGGILLIIALALQAQLDSYWEAKAPLVTIFLLLFTILFLSEAWFSRRYTWYLPVYLGIQAALVAVLLFIPPGFSVAASLYIVLIIQAVPRLSYWAGYSWLGIFIAIILVAFILDEGWIEGLSLLFLYSAAYAFVFVLATGLRDLEVAHRQLQTYTDQAEELAATKERNRLARNLHDSVTQTIFSMTLTAEAARILLERNSKEVAPQLNRLQKLAEHALSEMRSLIFELRPTSLTDKGFVATLDQHLERFEKEQGLSISLHVEGEEALSLEQADHLLRIVQEALNNVVKHAQTDKAVVNIRFDSDQTIVEISDEGKGFVLTTMSTRNQHMGLSSMEERVEMMAGTLRIDANPGSGTQIFIEIPGRNRDDQNG